MELLRNHNIYIKKILIILIIVCYFVFNLDYLEDQNDQQILSHNG